MKCKVIAIVMVIASLLVAMPDTVGRWVQFEEAWQKLGLTAQAAPSVEDFRWQGRLAAGQTLEVRGVNGEVSAEAAGGDQIEVTARKTGKRSNPEDVRIEVKEHAGGLLICAVYPSRDASEPNECGKRMSTYNNDVQVDFTIKLPAGVNLKAATVNGNIKIADLRSRVKASTVNGDVSVTTTGEAEANTVNGDVEVTMGRSESDEPLKYSTVNGDIRVKLSAGLDASFKASTVNGDINSDFGFDSYEGKHGPKSATGRIGNGGRKVSLSTVNGDISLNR